MNEDQWLAGHFEENRPRLEAVAHRMLGSASEAEDAVQETWLRLAGTRADDIDNLAGWLTTVVGRVCLDQLRSRRSRRERPIAEFGHETATLRSPIGDPEAESVLMDSVGLALLVVLDTLDPAERLAFVLHDTFAVPFDDIARILDRTPAASRQLASRARRRVQGTRDSLDVDQKRQQAVVEAFLSAARTGNFDALLAVLDPDVVVRTDAGSTSDFRHGATEVASSAITFATITGAHHWVLVNGKVGVLAGDASLSTRLLTFTVTSEVISELDVITDPAVLRDLELVLLDN
ncbi:RNA polymerase sigma-70 factor (ECF subfamily) [Lipingzhangella halophila]|uniref:RNA polymerase sigma-70 factor (ECF subfamily) n=1 Tax=Lipingzhangella halophila TaxID=1783352 RepID=A0A7W7RPM4_9ACTN|nr:sigma-70 family RNA polymerase sigma factor [Lipingzhangella halophila]MBB4935318.1 RNA polymerase sigma-70 factor (ECF subfamily) [Lipingzhangella halophila]